MKILMVEWQDSYSGSSWDMGYKSADTAKCISVGLLVSETASAVVLLPNICSTSTHGLHEIAIPKGAITRIRQLKISH